ncbi:type II toxin-antitoxin system ParD family antitoxin [Noviherbaspirillum sp. L7-7A]|uniref:ribbon-helix-helix domain-containing protein n=1 Tax=Noviherbaspirillum sp. L7-7A TaxID=2850560 RepID=UPI001C2CBD99|nr:type II toxin-antitoxin system ParD family antitoxin [Noviherbaspirillum sp. L7-7A]
MNISLPDDLKDFIEAQVANHHYTGSSEYLRELIRRDQARTQLRAILLEGAASPTGSDITDTYANHLQERIRERLARRA